MASILECYNLHDQFKIITEREREREREIPVHHIHCDPPFLLPNLTKITQSVKKTVITTNRTRDSTANVETKSANIALSSVTTVISVWSKVDLTQVSVTYSDYRKKLLQLHTLIKLAIPLEILCTVTVVASVCISAFSI